MYTCIYISITIGIEYLCYCIYISYFPGNTVAIDVKANGKDIVIELNGSNFVQVKTLLKPIGVSEPIITVIV